MPQSDRALAAGPEWLSYVFPMIAAEAVFYGLLLMTSILSTSVLLYKGIRHSTARKILMLVVVVMFSLCTAHFFLHYDMVFMQVPWVTGVDIPADIERRYNCMFATIEVLERACYLISDIVVVWRAWVIWYDSRPFQAFLAFSLLATAATSIALAVKNVLTQTKGQSLWPDTTANMLGTFGLLWTNVFATVSVFYKVWRYRKDIKASVTSLRKRTRMETLLLILADSGLIYCVFWIFMLAGDYGSFSPFGLEWFQPHFSGIYVSGVIFLIAFQRTSSDTFLTKNTQSTSTTISETIRFEASTPSDDRISAVA